jgi:hypothetical protein
MSNDTPVWFLDVDGVVNAISNICPEGFSSGYARPNEEHYNQYKIQWDPRVIDAINDLHRSGVIEVQWLTTWGSGANGELRKLIGINELDVACEPPGAVAESWATYAPPTPSREWWKLTFIKQWHEENPGRKFVWTDDDIPLEDVAEEFVKQTMTCFAIAPLQQRTLTIREVDRVERWLLGRGTREYIRHGFQVNVAR